ncbi:MAG: thioredoxin domain-containing protein [Bacteroidota bacterium]
MKKIVFVLIGLQLLTFFILFQLYKRVLINEALYEEAKYQIVVGKYPRVSNPEQLENAESVVFGEEMAPNNLKVLLSTDCYYCNEFINKYLDTLFQAFVEPGKINIELIYIGYLDNSYYQLNHISTFYSAGSTRDKFSVLNEFHPETETELPLPNDKKSEFARVDSMIVQNRNIAYELNIYQFPTFILNERVIKGLPSLEDFLSILEVELNYAY